MMYIVNYYDKDDNMEAQERYDDYFNARHAMNAAIKSGLRYRAELIECKTIWAFVNEGSV